LCTDLGAELDALIAGCTALYAGRGERFEWKLYGHDRPPDLARRLEAAGLIAEERETVEVAVAASITGEPELPEGVALREVSERADLDRIARFEETIWGDDRAWLADMLEGEQTADPESLAIAVARPPTGSSALAGCGSHGAQTSLRSGAARRCPGGAAEASTARSSRTERIGL
jgi:hypothetical protein